MAVFKLQIVLKSVTPNFFFSDGFKPVNDAQTIFKKEKDSSFLIVAIYVDDSLNGHNNSSLYNDFCKKFQKRFKIKAHDQVDIFLGIGSFMTV